MRIFRPGPGPHALTLAMAGVKLGERVLDVGAAASALFAELAGKVGLTGRALAVVSTDAAAAQVKSAAARAGVLVEVEVSAWPALPVASGEFDLVIIDETAGLLAALDEGARVGLAREALRALRDGGRALVIEREPRKWFGGQAPAAAVAFQGHGGARALLERAGFAPVRVLAERESQRFTEGWKTQAVKG